MKSQELAAHLNQAYLSLRHPEARLEALLRDAGALKTDPKAAERSVQQAQNLHRFFEMIKKFSQVAQYDRVHYFIEHVESLRVAGEDPASAQAALDENAVHILTVHAAKGLEFPVVFLVGLEQGHFPANNRGSKIEPPEELIRDILPTGNTHAQEERRLFYVGVTRAKRELILCSAKDHGKKRVWKTSQFVLECLDQATVEKSAV
ncbi:MAG: ATP-dependent helicase, partial [Deltaproteobacteria bacterium]|nr:ATP-dependent helicase [Deltaproteobacteria bacterium]